MFYRIVILELLHPTPTANAYVFASADSSQCEYTAVGNPGDGVTCLGVTQSETTSSFATTAARGTASSLVQYQSGGSALITAATAAGGPPRADGKIGLSNRFVVLSDTLPAGTVVSLTAQIPLSGTLTAQFFDNKQCNSGSTGQMHITVGINFTLLHPGGNSILLTPGVRSQRFDCQSTRIDSMESSTITFGLSNNVPVVLSAPRMVQQTLSGSTGALALSPLTVNFQVPVGEEFQFYVDLHANAEMSGGQAGSSATINVSPIQIGPLPSGVFLPRIQ